MRQALCLSPRRSLCVTCDFGPLHRSHLIGRTGENRTRQRNLSVDSTSASASIRTTMAAACAWSTGGWGCPPAQPPPQPQSYWWPQQPPPPQPASVILQPPAAPMLPPPPPPWHYHPHTLPEIHPLVCVLCVIVVIKLVYPDIYKVRSGMAGVILSGEGETKQR